jgi:hypothetical protein
MRLGFAVATGCARAVIALTACALMACAASTSAGDGDYMDDDLPMGMCGATGCDTDQGGVPVGFPCAGTNECSGDAVCIAPFTDGDVGEFTCAAQCVPLDDDSTWCLDSSACCDANAVCNPRGLCIMGDPAADDTAGSGGSSGSSTGDASSDTGASSSTGGDSTGDSTGGGSSTGGQ